MDLAILFRVVEGDDVEMGLEGVDQLGVELGDEGVVRLFLVVTVEDVPGQVVNIPGVDEVDVGESQRDGSAGLGEGGDVEVGSKRDGGSNSGLQTQMSMIMFKKRSSRSLTLP